MHLKDRESGLSWLTVGCIVLFVLSICGCAKIVSNCCQCPGKSNLRETNSPNRDINNPGQWPWPGYFAGTVTSTTGIAVAGAQLYFTLLSTGTVYNTVTNSNGYYHSQGLPAPNSYDITVSASGYGTNTTDNNIYLSELETQYRNYTMTPLQRFKGTVTSSTTGLGIPGARMDFNGPTNTSRERNQSGYYQSILLDPGTYTIIVSAFGYGTQTDTGITLPPAKVIKKNYQLIPYP